jgi:hypothetical protein
MSGRVAELWVGETLAGEAVLFVHPWGTVKGRLWSRRLEDLRDLPELHVVLFGPGDGQTRYRHDPWCPIVPEDVERLIESVIEARRLEWHGVDYTLRWLDDARSAALRAELGFDEDA